MNLDSMNLLQRWVSDIFQAQRTFKGRDNKSAVRFFSYVHLTLVTLFFHFYSYSPTEGVITLPAMAHNFCVRKQVPKSWFECYVDYTSRDKVREAVEQHNPNKSELFCYSAFFFFFFPITVELKAKEEVQMLPTGFCKAFDTAPTTTPFSPNCRWMDEDWLDGCIQQWSGQRLNVPVNTGDKWCPSVQLSLVGLLSYLQWACAQMLPPKHRFYSESKET